VLDLESNNIGREGATAISKALKTNQSLQDLDLNSNDIGSEGTAVIAKALKTNYSLRMLELGFNNNNNNNNNIEREVLATIAKALERNR